MGQAYKGTEATFLDDAMFKLPYELMGTIIDKKEKQIQEDLDSRNALSDLLKAEGLKVDEPRLQQILKGYQDEIDSSVEDIYNDPVNYSREGVQKLKRKITEDFTIGEVAAIQGNKLVFDTWKKEQAEKIKKNPELYDADLLDNLSSDVLSRFKGTSYKGPSEYSTISPDEAIGIKDTLSVLEDIMKGAVPDFESSSWDNDRGGWNIKGKDSTKFFKPQDLQNMYLGFLKTNPEYTRGIAQRERVGVPGWSGNFTEEGMPSFEKGSHFLDSMELLKTKYGGVERTTERSQTLNEIGIQEYKDRMETVYVDTALTGKQANVYTNYAGKNIQEFNTIWNKNKATQENTKTQALEMLVKTGGYSSLTELEKAKPNVVKAIKNGNFSSIMNTAEGKRIASEYKNAEFQQEVLRASKAEFKRQYNVDPAVVDGKTYTFTDPKTKQKVKLTAQQAFTNFLSDNYVSKQDVNMSWKLTNVTKKVMDQVSEQVINNKIHLDTPLTLPDGFIVEYKGKKVDLSRKKMSVNELIDKGYLVVDQKVAASAAGVPTAYVSGTNTINFSTGSKTGVVPILALNDSGNIEYGVSVNINGKNITARLSNISTEPVEKLFQGREGKIFKGQRALAKIGKVQYTFPGTNVTYYGRDVLDGNGKIIIPSGTLINGAGKRFNANNEDALELIGEIVP